MAMVWASSYSSGLAPSLGTFMCHGCGPKKEKKKKKWDEEKSGDRGKKGGGQGTCDRVRWDKDVEGGVFEREGRGRNQTEAADNDLKEPMTPIPLSDGGRCCLRMLPTV